MRIVKYVELTTEEKTLLEEMSGIYILGPVSVKSALIALKQTQKRYTAMADLIIPMLEDLCPDETHLPTFPRMLSALIDKLERELS